MPARRGEERPRILGVWVVNFISLAKSTHLCSGLEDVSPLLPRLIIHRRKHHVDPSLNTFEAKIAVAGHDLFGEVRGDVGVRVIDRNFEGGTIGYRHDGNVASVNLEEVVPSSGAPWVS